MDNKKKIIIGVGVLLVLGIIWYFYSKAKAAEAKAKAQEEPPCKPLEYHVFEQKKTDYYWTARNYSSQKQAEINAKYKKPGDGTFDALWRWASAQVEAEGYCPQKTI